MSFSGMSDNLCRLSAGIRIGFSLSDPSVSGGADTCDRINLDRLFMDGTLWIISDRDDRKNSGDDCFACNVFDRGYYVFIDCVLLGFAGGVTARMMCVVLGILPNGLPARPGEMTWTPQVMDPNSLWIGTISAVVWFFILWITGKIWYERRMKK